MFNSTDQIYIYWFGHWLNSNSATDIKRESLTILNREQMEKRLMLCSDQFWSRKQKSDSHDIHSWLASRNKIGIPSQARQLRYLRGVYFRPAVLLPDPATNLQADQQQQPQSPGPTSPSLLLQQGPLFSPSPPHQILLSLPTSGRR